MKKVKQEIYNKLAELKESKKKIVLAWDGRPYTTLIWWLAYKDLGYELPIVFLDNNKHDPKMYSFVHDVINKYKLKAQIVICKNIAEGMAGLVETHDIVLTASGIEKDGSIKKVNIGTNIIPPTMEAWNLLKTLGVPYYQTKKNTLG